jgi:phage terminase small subunit
MALIPRQARFVEEYLVDFNGSAAAVRAGYSAHTARSLANRLLTYADIQAAIAEAVKRRSERTEVTQDRVLLELARMAYADPRKMVGPDGRVLDLHEMPEELGSLLDVEHITDKATGETRQVVRFSAAVKAKALDLLGRHLRLWDRNGKPLASERKPAQWVITPVQPGLVRVIDTQGRVVEEYRGPPREGLLPPTPPSPAR